MANLTEKDLSKYDLILMIDKSGSMSHSGAHSKSRWQEAKETTEALAIKCAEFDDDGIDVVPFATTFKIYEGTTPDKVHQIFTENEPKGGTDTANALKAVLDARHFGKTNGKPTIVVIITDGEPDDETALQRVIVDAANRINDDNELGIQFLQVGNDQKAHAFLKRLDDELVDKVGAKFDIVDTMTFDELEGKTLVDALLGAVND